MSEAGAEQFVSATDSLPALRALIALILEASLDRVFVVPPAVRQKAAAQDATIIVTELQNGALLIKMERHQ